MPVRPLREPSLDAVSRLCYTLRDIARFRWVVSATQLIKTGRGNGPKTPGNRRAQTPDAVLTPAEGAQASFPKDEPHLYKAPGAAQDTRCGFSLERPFFLPSVPHIARQKDASRGPAERESRR